MAMRYLRKPTFRLAWMKNKGAVLVIVWCFLSTSVFYLLMDSLVTNFVINNDGPRHINFPNTLLFGGVFLAPIGGWIADSWLGRYKTVKYSMWIMWVGTILLNLGEILAQVNTTYDSEVKVWVFLALSVVLCIGLAGYQSNIVQLGIDQLSDASADEIKSFIFWFLFVYYFSHIVLNFVTECAALLLNMFFIKTLFVASCLTVMVCSDYLCQKWLVKECSFGRPLRETINILCYIAKNSRRRYEYTINNDTDDLPSRFSIAKHQYGGPYTSVQVNNVRTLLWMLVVLATSSVVFGVLSPIEFARDSIMHRFYTQSMEAQDLSSCYHKLLLHYEDYIIACGGVVLYEFLVHPFLHRCLPRTSITSRIILSVAMLLLWILTLFAIEVVAYTEELKTPNASIRCIFYGQPDTKVGRGFILIPDFIGGVLYLIVFSTGLQFIWAQTPTTMKGLMFGIVYALLGLSTLLQGAISVPFFFNIHEIDWHPLTCSLWYFIMESGFVFIALICIVSVVQMYQKRDNNRQKNDIIHSTYNWN